MNARIPCITDSDEFRFEPDNMDRAHAIEAYADEMLADCRVFHNAESINSANSLYDGDLLPDLMVAIASWNGSTDSAVVQMRVMHNLLANALQKIAEEELS